MRGPRLAHRESAPRRSGPGRVRRRPALRALASTGAVVALVLLLPWNVSVPGGFAPPGSATGPTHTVAPLATAPPTSAYDWAEFHGNSNLTGVASNSPITTSNAARLGVVWASDLYGAALDSPVVAYDVTLGKTLTYIGTETGNVLAIDMANGQTVWSTWLGSPIRPTPEVSNGSLWIGSPSSGLLHFSVRTHRFKVYYHHRGRSDTLSNDRVNGVMVSRSGAVWVSTQNGLDRLNPGTGRFTDYYERNGLAGNAVSCTLQDRLGDIWAGTADGLSRLDPWTGRFRNYGEGEGLPGPDLTGWHACFRAPDGQMYFGGFSGAVTFRPRRVKTSNLIPPVVLTQFDLDGAPVALGPGSPLRRSIDYTRKIVLPHNDDNFSFSFAALSFRNPLTNRYRYRLLGLQGAWHEAASDQRTASYTTLGPGKYRFEVEGATLRSRWSPVTGVSIDILRPWWQTWWFKLAAIIALIIGNVMAYFLHIRRLAHQMEIRFEERVAERASIAQDLHDSLLQGFQGLMFSLQAVRKMLPDDPQQAGRALERALERGDESIAEARDAVRSLRAPKSDTDLIDALKTLAGEFAAGDEIGAPSFRVIAEGRPRPISPWVRDEVYQISREALRNAHRHAQAKNLEAEIIFGASALTVRVRDDGIGLDREILERGVRTGHWGLPGMRERAARIGGRLSLWSEMKAGTEIEVTIPAAIAYRKTHERANRLDQE